ncbi:MAG: hypothetical protein EHM58_10840 [Ignavibacteriae bacterium]|nr:MAG: hypothetical protein EHM58_10840 [Ignavibacteriota bacterium]
MKKVLILYIILFVGTAYSQVMPKEYKLDARKFTDKQLSQLDAVNNIYGKRLTAVPEPTPSIISNFISDILVAGDTIWFGTGKGVSRTTNNGVSFQNYHGLEPFGDYDVSGIAVYKNFVVVATAESRDVNGETEPAGTGIKVSSDFGTTWHAYPQPMESGTGRFDSLIYGSNVIPALKVLTDIRNLSYDVLITRKNTTSDSIVIWITSWAGALRKSTDYGATFTRVILPPDDNSIDSIYPGGNYTGSSSFAYDPVVNDNHKCFSITAENDSTIYVGTALGINRSTDWGVSWKKNTTANSGNRISGNFVVGLNVQRYAGHSIVWGATNVGGGTGNQINGFSYTTNSGTSWGKEVTDSAFSHGVGFKDSVVYAADDNGIWRSNFVPLNFNWAKPNVIYDEDIRDYIRSNSFYAVDSKGDSIWVGSGDGLARTRDLGNPWTEKWKIFRAYKPISSTQESYAAPNPFSPDDEVTRIFYKTGKTSASVTIRIFDFAMNPVRVLIQNAQRTTPEVVWTAWDGKRDDGMQVANGVYFYRIEVDNDMTFWGKILVLQ